MSEGSGGRESGWAAGLDRSFLEVSETPGPEGQYTLLGGGGCPGSKHWGSFKATSILPAVMEQAAAHPGSPSRGGPQRSAGG